MLNRNKWFSGSGKYVVPVVCFLALSLNLSADMSSAGYQIFWDDVNGSEVVESGSYSIRLSANILQGDVGSSASYDVISGFYAPPDTDSDAIRNFLDNCTDVENADQRDSNKDGYGNLCDGDLNNDGAVNFLDLGIMRSVFLQANEDADLNGDGVVDLVDLDILRGLFFKPPGPSGLAP